MDMRSDSVIMLLAGGVIGPLTGMLISELTDRIAGICANTLTEVYAAVVLVVMIAFDGIAPESYAPNVWTGGAFVSDLGLTAVWVTVIAALGFMKLLKLLGELLLFCWIACCC